jgi:hypothetical protein
MAMTGKTAMKRSKLELAALEFVSAKGWKPGDVLGLTSVVGLMEQFAGMKLTEAAQKAAKLLDGYDTGDDGFGVEDAICSLYR